jgi:cytochrome oxidase Cu insertion factor (SCO1/SenC/PrrC family)/thiol-disulfide isomerase/thioredoxin
MRRLALFAAALVCLLAPSVAVADGDPGSDVLLAQNLFASSSAGLTVPQQLQLGTLLKDTATLGAPVRVAIIAHRSDLGVDTPLWGDPQGYSAYLASELSLTYSGRLLVVMPNGYGFYWYGHDATIKAVAAQLQKLPAPGRSLVSGTVNAVRAAELDSGVPASSVQTLGSGTAAAGTGAATQTRPQAGAGSGAPASVAGNATLASNAASVPSSLLTPQHSSTGALGGTLIAIAILVIALLLVIYRWGLAVPGVGRLKSKPHVLMASPLVVLLGVAGVISLTHSGSSSTRDTAHAFDSNPDLLGNTLSHKPAPNFTLTDENGRRISLDQYRGKVVVLAFIDAECQTICPLTNEAMLDAKRELGSAGKDVQLLAVDANWKSTQIQDVQNYTQLHGMTGEWHFLTGSLGQLQNVWTAYNINEQALEKANSNEIDHVPALYVISPKGRFSSVFQTEQSYSSIPQLGQLLADEASSLLPSHPRVLTDYTLAHVASVTPRQRATVPSATGGSLRLGPGKPHLYLFFDTWDTQTTTISAQMDKLNAYARAERAKGLPSLMGIDEGTVEPDASALPRFLKKLPTQLDYPVGTDTTGQIADGYEVQGEPWFVETNAQGKIVWFQEVYTEGWPTLATLERNVRAGLRPGAAHASATTKVKQELAGSPAPLAVLHHQSAKLLSGGQTGLDSRIKQLTGQGYPVVVNVWGSWCPPCQREFPLFANASAAYGRQVAFIGADYNDKADNAKAFLDQHRVSYPSYATSIDSMTQLLPGGVGDTPTTLYYGPNGKLLYTKIGQYDSQGTLDEDIETYALGPNG